MQLRFVTLRHVTFTLCCFTLCSKILFSAGIFKQSMGARNRVGICRDVVHTSQATQPGGIGSLESILGLLQSLKIRAQASLQIRESESMKFLYLLKNHTVWKPRGFLVQDLKRRDILTMLPCDFPGLFSKPGGSFCENNQNKLNPPFRVNLWFEVKAHYIVCFWV